MIMIRLRDKTGEMYRMFDVEHIDIDMRDKRIDCHVRGLCAVDWESYYYEDYTFNDTGSACFIDVWVREE